MIELPLIMRSMTGKEEIYTAQVYVIDADVAFLCGKKTIELWGSKLDTVNSILETEINKNTMNSDRITTRMGHYCIRLEVQKIENSRIIYLEEKRDELSHFRAIKKVHEPNNHRRAD